MDLDLQLRKADQRVKRLLRAKAIAQVDALDGEIEKARRERDRWKERIRERERKRAQRMDEIIEATCEAYDTTLDALMSGRRFEPLPDARHAVFYFAWMNGLALSSAARKLDVHHSTAIHGRDKIERMLGANAGLTSKVEEIEAKL